MKTRLENRARVLSRQLQDKLQISGLGKGTAPVTGGLREEPIAWLVLLLGLGLVAGAFRFRAHPLAKMAWMLGSKLWRQDSVASKQRA